MHPADAAKVIDCGMDGIIVSNHGGRQVDGAKAAVDALPEIVDTIGGKVPVLFDSGIRTGSDIFKALALGVEAILIGRTYPYGLSIAGKDGVREVIQNFHADLELTMRLSGVKKISEIYRNLLEWNKLQ